MKKNHFWRAPPICQQKIPTQNGTSCLSRDSSSFPSTCFSTFFWSWGLQKKSRSENEIHTKLLFFSASPSSGPPPTVGSWSRSFPSWPDFCCSCSSFNGYKVGIHSFPNIFCLENFTTISLFWHFTAILSFAKRLHPQLQLHHRGLPDPPGHHVPDLLLYPGGLFLLPGEYRTLEEEPLLRFCFRS